MSYLMFDAERLHLIEMPRSGDVMPHYRVQMESYNTYLELDRTSSRYEQLPLGRRR